MIGEADVLSGLVYTDAPSELDLLEDVGMRTIDVWVARGRHDRIALGSAPDAATFWAPSTPNRPNIPTTSFSRARGCACCS